MAIIKEVTDEGTVGFQKRLDPAAAQMLIDAQQTKQYKFPERSTIRELTANGIDAVYEKNTAIKILTGKISKDEVYKTRHDSAYADSNFFPGYFDLKYLDPKDEVTIRMIRGYEHDQLIIRDTGVGVGNVPHPVTGKSRLEGILEIGYSTKRNTDNELGSFGIGGKSALSMGVDSYMFTSRHNGKLNQFRVYNFHFNCLIGKLREGAVKDYLYPKSDSPHEIYYLEEEGYNYTEISVRTQKSQRQLLESAVLDQFQYFDNVHFYIVDEDGTERKVEIESNILYESESIVIPDPKSSQYTRPHIVLRGINYGLVEFENMELETKFGSIGYKIPPSSVDVDRSRESLIWNEKTRKSVSAFINDTQPELERVLKESFDKLDKVDRVLYSLGASKPEFSLIDLIKDLLPRENSDFMVSLHKIKTNPVFNLVRGHEVKVNPQRLARHIKSLKVTSSFKDKYDIPTSLGYRGNEEIISDSLIRNRHKDPILFLDGTASVTAKQRVSAFLHFQSIEDVEGFDKFYIVYGKIDSKPIKLFKTLIEKMGIPYAFLNDIPEISDSYSINEEDIKSEAEYLEELNRKRARAHSKWKRENVAINYRVDDYIKGATPAEEINKNIEKSGADYAVWGVGTFVSSNPGKDEQTLSLAQRIYTHFKLSNPMFSKWGSKEHVFTNVEEYKKVFPEPGSVTERIYRQSDSSVNFFEISKSNERLFVNNIDKNLHVSNLLRGTTGLKNALDFRWCGKILTFFAYAEEYVTYIRDFKYATYEVVTLAGRDYEFALINLLNNLIDLTPGWSSVSSGWGNLPRPIYFEGRYLDNTLEKYCNMFFEQYEDNKDEAILKFMDNVDFKVFGRRNSLTDKYALYLMKVARYARFLLENPDAPEDLVISLACSTFGIDATEKNFDEKLIPRKILGLDVNFKENFDKVSEAFNMFPKFKGREHARLEVPGFSREESIDMLTKLAETGYFNN